MYKNQPIPRKHNSNHNRNSNNNNNNNNSNNNIKKNSARTRHDFKKISNFAINQNFFKCFWGKKGTQKGKNKAEKKKKEEERRKKKKENRRKKKTEEKEERKKTEERKRPKRKKKEERNTCHMTSISIGFPRTCERAALAVGTVLSIRSCT